MLLSRVNFLVPLLLVAGALAGCGGGGRSVPPAATAPTSVSPLGAIPKLPNLAVPRRPAFISTVPKLPSSLATGRAASALTPHPAFFNGEAALSNGVYYLALPNSNIFGYYSYLPDSHFIYHFDLGYEYLIDANDGTGGLYMYDFASGHWWYTGAHYPFPYLYDFTLNAFLYYFPDTKNPQHYTTSPRYFYNFTAGQIATIPSALQAPAVGYLGPASNGSVDGILNNVSSSVTLVGVSETIVQGGPGVTVPTASVAVGFGPTVLSAKRSPRTLDQRFAPIASVERAVEGPAEYRALTRGLRHASRAPDAVRRTRSLPVTQGATNPFWISTGAIGTGGTTQAQRTGTLRAVTPHGYIWVDGTLATIVTDTMVQSIANDFENAYVSDTAHFGTPAYSTSSPGMTSGSNPACDANGAPTGANVPNFIVPTDNKAVVFVVDVHGLGTGVGGYFTPANYLYQSALNCLIGHGYTALNLPQSNEAPMIVVGYNNDPVHGLTPTFETQEDLVRGTAHELQHDINFVNHLIVNPGADVEETWINEGMSMLAQDLAVHQMYPAVPIDVDDAGGRAYQYLLAPETYSLTAFSSVDDFGTHYNCSGCYGLEYLFQRYLYDRFGGDAYLQKMLGTSTGTANLQQATGIDPAQAIGDFAIAVAASGTNATSDARYGFTGINLRGTYTDQFGNPNHVYAGPAALPLVTQTSSFPLGSFFYMSGDSTAAGKTVTASDASGGSFQLRAGVVQR